MSVADGFGDGLDEGVDLSGGEADVAHGVEQVIEIDALHERLSAEAFDEVVGFAFVLDSDGGGLAVSSDGLVDVLPIASEFDGGHHAVFRCEEGEFGHDVGADGGDVDIEAGGDVVEEVEGAVEGEEGFGEGEPAIGGVVECAFEPLGGAGVVGVLGEGDDESAQACGAFAAHGVSFVGHGGGADLGVCEGFVEFLAVGHESDVVADFVDDGGDRGAVCKDEGVDDARVGLSGQFKAHRGIEAEFADDEFIEVFDLGGVALEEFEEGGLRAGGALDAPESDGVAGAFEPGEREREVVGPVGGAFAQGGGLGGLVVGEGEDGQVAEGDGEVGERVDASGDFHCDQAEGIAQEEQFGVAVDELAGGAEMDDGAGFGGDIAQRVDVGHDVVAELVFVCGGSCDVLVGDFEVFAELVELGGGDGQAQLLLGLGQCEPESAPGFELSPGRPDRLHLGRGVAGCQWGDIPGHG